MKSGFVTRFYIYTQFTFLTVWILLVLSFFLWFPFVSFSFLQKCFPEMFSRNVFPLFPTPFGHFPFKNSLTRENFSCWSVGAKLLCLLRQQLALSVPKIVCHGGELYRAWGRFADLWLERSLSVKRDKLRSLKITISQPESVKTPQFVYSGYQTKTWERRVRSLWPSSLQAPLVLISFSSFSRICFRNCMLCSLVICWSSSISVCSVSLFRKSWEILCEILSSPEQRSTAAVLWYLSTFDENPVSFFLSDFEWLCRWWWIRGRDDDSG